MVLIPIMVKPSKTQKENNDNRVHIPGPLKNAIITYAENEKARQTDPAIKSLIDWKSMAAGIIESEMTRMGFYKQ